MPEQWPWTHLSSAPLRRLSPSPARPPDPRTARGNMHPECTLTLRPWEHEGQRGVRGLGRAVADPGSCPGGRRGPTCAFTCGYRAKRKASGAESSELLLPGHNLSEQGLVFLIHCHSLCQNRTGAQQMIALHECPRAPQIRMWKS